MIIDLQKPIPKYHVVKKNIVRLIIFTALFALVFINIYSPFGADSWFDLTKVEFLSYSSIVILTGVMVVVISRVIMYFVCKKKMISVLQYLAWITAEAVLMASFYSLFQKYVLKDSRDIFDLIKLFSLNTALVLLLPYMISWLYLAWRDKKEVIDRLEELTSLSGSTREMIPFFDDKSVLKFSVKKESLLYLEATENYISISYLNNGKISKYLLRETMKRMEEKFAGTEIIRCHRSYMVNFDKVKIIRKDRDGLKLDLDDPAVTGIPVSKTYVDKVMETFSRYSRFSETS